MVSLGIVGDIHGAFTEADLTFFNRSDYTVVLIVGDIEAPWPPGSKKVTRQLAKLRKPSLLIPGNHDGTRLIQLAGEVLRAKKLIKIGGLGQKTRVKDLESQLGNVQLCGYSLHHFPETQTDPDFDIIACRPHSMGGPSLTFADFLRQQFRIGSMDESAERLKSLVEQSTSENVIFFAHNGPTGLGDLRDDIWGKDFGSGHGDHGDPDLEEALEFALQLNKRVIAVIGGHMHHKLKGGGFRKWLIERNGTHYVNAARVPRIFDRGGQTIHHHVKLNFDRSSSTIEEVFV